MGKRSGGVAMSISKFTALLTHEIELELTVNDGIVFN